MNQKELLEITIDWILFLSEQLWFRAIFRNSWELIPTLHTNADEIIADLTVDGGTAGETII